MTDQVLTIRLDHNVPPRVGRRMKAFNRVVELADQATNPSQIIRRRGRQRAGHLARYELKDVPSELIAPQCAGRARETNRRQMLQ